MVTQSASAKIILFGEHAVVYGRPALAVPLPGLRTFARVELRARPGVIIHARDLHRTILLDTAPTSDPLARVTRLALAEANAPADVGLELWLESDIPLASGLGSGAAVSTALVRAIAAQFAVELSPERISALVFEAEKIYHGTPSGIDNTVIALERPIWFTRKEGGRPFPVARSFPLIIAHTGMRSPTRITVGDVRRGWEQEPARYERLFDAIAAVVEAAREALGRGETEAIGALFRRNQVALRDLGVSSPQIEQLISAAEAAGAEGAKLSGGGRGGNVIVYPGAGDVARIESALLEAGAAGVLVTKVEATERE